MIASVGDWLVVESSREDVHAHCAEVIALSHPDGSPPYTVRWLEDGRETLMLPGPDARLFTLAQIEAQDRTENPRFARIHDALRNRRRD